MDLSADSFAGTYTIWKMIVMDNELHKSLQIQYMFWGVSLKNSNRCSHNKPIVMLQWLSYGFCTLDYSQMIENVWISLLTSTLLFGPVSEMVTVYIERERNRSSTTDFTPYKGEYSVQENAIWWYWGELQRERMCDICHKIRRVIHSISISLANASALENKLHFPSSY